jgi:hypothetical protein
VLLIGTGHFDAGRGNWSGEVLLHWPRGAPPLLLNQNQNWYDSGGNYWPLLWWGLCSLDPQTPLSYALSQHALREHHWSRGDFAIPTFVRRILRC